MDRNIKIAIIGLSLIALGGCKPTERNYKSAYDVAILKKEREDSLKRERQRELGLGGVVMEENSDGSRLMTVGGTEVLTLHATMAKEDTVRRYAPAVALFKMPANAESFASDLAGEGWKRARMAKSGARYFVILDSFDSGEEAVALLKSYKGKKGSRVVGLREPLLLVTPGR